MDEYWKDPRLDDEGTYDYLVEELPKDYARWEFTKEKWRCDECGKHSHLMLYAAHHFYCWDGWDSMSYNTCWRCMMESKIRSFVYKIKKRIKLFKSAFKLRKESGWDFETCLNFVKGLE